MAEIPLTFLFDFNTLDDKARAYIINEFAENGAKHLVLTDTLLKWIMADFKLKEKLLGEVSDAGLTFVDSHAQFGPFLDLNCPVPEARPEMLLRHKLELQILNSMGIKTITIHVGNENIYPDYTLEQQTDAIKRSLDELLPMAEALDITICIENIWSKISTPENLLLVKEAFPSDALGFCFDSGHANLMDKGRYNPESNPFRAWKDTTPRWDDQILEKMLPHIVNCHLHDNIGVTDLHVNIGSGNIDWDHIGKVLFKAPKLKVVQSEVIPIRGNESIKSVCEKFLAFMEKYQ